MVGNLPNFNDMDVFRCFLLIGERTSRAELVRKLELGEGTVRSILNILKRKRLISSTKGGHSLTKKGNDAYNSIRKVIAGPRRIGIELFYPNTHKTGILIRSYRRYIDHQLRDVAIRHGSIAAFILKYDNKLIMPAPTGRQYRFRELEELFSYKNKDLLIISIAATKRLAENSAMAVVLELNKDLRGL